MKEYVPMCDRCNNAVTVDVEFSEEENNYQPTYSCECTEWLLNEKDTQVVLAQITPTIQDNELPF